MMTEDQIREFLAIAFIGGGSVIEQITERWLKDREEAADAARDAIYDDQHDDGEDEPDSYYRSADAKYGYPPMP